MTNQTFDEQLKEKLSDSAIILEANRDVAPRKYEIALELFLDDAIKQIKAAIREHMPPKRTRSNQMKDTVSAALLHTLDEKEYNTAIDDVAKGLGL